MKKLFLIVLLTLILCSYSFEYDLSEDTDGFLGDLITKAKDKTTGFMSKAKETIKEKYDRYRPINHDEQNERNSKDFSCPNTASQKEKIAFASKAAKWVYVPNYNGVKFNSESIGFGPQFSLVKVIEQGPAKLIILENKIEKYIIVAVRGTRFEKLEDWKANINLLPVEGNDKIFTSAGLKIEGRAQKGFLTKALTLFQLKEYQDIVKKYNTNGYEIILTGHSQGGSLCGWIALFTKNMLKNANLQVITFGSPQYLSSRAIKSYSQILNRYCRIEFNEDVIIRINKLYNSPGFSYKVPSLYKGPIDAHKSYVEYFGSLCRDLCQTEERYYVKKTKALCPKSCDKTQSSKNKSSTVDKKQKSNNKKTSITKALAPKIKEAPKIEKKFSTQLERPVKQTKKEKQVKETVVIDKKPKSKKVKSTPKVKKSIPKTKAPKSKPKKTKRAKRSNNPITIIINNNNKGRRNGCGCNNNKCNRKSTRQFVQRQVGNQQIQSNSGNQQSNEQSNQQSAGNQQSTNSNEQNNSQPSQEGNSNSQNEASNNENQASAPQEGNSEGSSNPIDQLKQAAIGKGKELLNNLKDKALAKGKQVVDKLKGKAIAKGKQILGNLKGKAIAKGKKLLGRI